ncbi:MAG: F0F1 ATP synthase subunit B [Chloroflexi bacterium]|nr:F0F1 ATP synthase subunit B [Chloroflexota bacterium]
MEALGIDPNRLLSSVFNFTVLLILLWFFLYKPVLKMLEERKERIRQGLADAEAARQAARRAQEDYQRQMEQAHKDAQAIIALATQAAEKAREEILAQGREEARAIVAKAQEKIEYERRQAILELRGQVAELAILAASKVISRELDERAHRQLIQEFLAETASLN